MAYDTYEDDLLRRQSADVIGAKLDAARKARALQNTMGQLSHNTEVAG